MTRWLHSRRGVIEGEDLCSTNKPIDDTEDDDQ